VTIKAARKLMCVSALAGLMAGSFAFTAMGQDADAEKTYALLLQQIADVQASTDQKRLFLVQQEEQISSLKSQIASADDLKDSIRPMVVEKVAAIEKEMVKDVSFNYVERFSRLDRLKEDLDKPDAPIASVFRQLMNLYETEVIAGISVASYNGQNPVNPGTRLAACDADIKSTACDLPKAVKDAIGEDATKVENELLRESIYDGYYLHFGRLSLIYLQFDSSEAWKFDKEAGSNGDWVEMDRSDVLDARRAVRIARGESAPDVVLAPIEIGG
jgi:hypothetical protein